MQNHIKSPTNYPYLQNFMSSCKWGRFMTKCIPYVAVSGDQILRFNHWAVFQMLRNQLENSRFRFIDALCFIKIFCLRLIFRECVAWWSKTKCGFSKTKSQTPYIAGILPITQFINLATLATALTVLLEWSGLGSRQNSQYFVDLALFGFLSLKNHIFGYKIFTPSSDTFLENQK